MKAAWFGIALLAGCSLANTSEEPQEPPVVSGGTTTGDGGSDGGSDGTGGDGGEPQVTSVFVSVQNAGGGRVLSSPAGIDCGTACTETFAPPPADGIFLDATPDEGWNFVRWTGDCNGIGTCDVPIQETVNVMVTFSQDPVLSVQKVGNGMGSIISSPDGIDCGAECDSDASAFVSGTSITLSATPEEGTIFVGWTGAGCTGTDNCTVTLTGNTTIEAEFVLEKRTLDLAKVGAYNTSGSVLSMPTGIDCDPPCTSQSFDFDYGTSVTLTATPYMTSGYEFSGYSGDCTGMSCTLQMTEDRSVDLTFSPE